MIFFLLTCLFVVVLCSAVVQYQKSLEAYTKSKTLLRESPDDFRRREAGASIVDIITETRAPRLKIIPVLEQLQKDELIVVDNNDDGTVVYKLY